MAVDPKTLRRGIYRIKYSGGVPNDVQVQDVAGGCDIPLDEETYRDRGYGPPVEHLPWRDDYFAAREAAQPGETGILKGDEK